jgi:hypothetical protein
MTLERQRRRPSPALNPRGVRWFVREAEKRGEIGGRGRILTGTPNPNLMRKCKVMFSFSWFTVNSYSLSIVPGAD